MRTAAAWGFVVLAACGDDGSRRPVDPFDALPPDIDAATDAPPEGDQVTLTITDRGAPRAGVTVYFHQPDGVLAAKVATDAGGVARATLRSGGTVTAIDPLDDGSATRHALRTFVGVVPGDQLRIHEDYAAANVSVALPANTGSTFYTVVDHCANHLGGTTPSFTSMFGHTCSDTTVAAIAFAGAINDPVDLAYLSAPNVQIADGTTLDLTAQTWTRAASPPHRLSNIPTSYSGTAEIQAGALVADGVMSFYPDIRIRDFQTEGSELVGAVPRIDIGAPWFNYRFRNDTTTQLMQTWGPPADAYALDVGATMVQGFATLPAFDTGAYAFHWLSDPGRIPNAMRAVFAVTRTGMYLDWEVAGTASGASLGLPHLPADVPELAIQATDTITISQFAVYALPDPTRLRRDPFGSFSSDRLASGSSGHLEWASAKLD